MIFFFMVLAYYSTGYSCHFFFFFFSCESFCEVHVHYLHDERAHVPCLFFFFFFFCMSFCEVHLHYLHDERAHICMRIFDMHFKWAQVHCNLDSMQRLREKTRSIRSYIQYQVQFLVDLVAEAYFFIFFQVYSIQAISLTAADTSLWRFCLCHNLNLLFFFLVPFFLFPFFFFVFHAGRPTQGAENKRETGAEALPSCYPWVPPRSGECLRWKRRPPMIAAKYW